VRGTLASPPPPQLRYDDAGERSSRNFDPSFSCTCGALETSSGAWHTTTSPTITADWSSAEIGWPGRSQRVTTIHIPAHHECLPFDSAPPTGSTRRGRNREKGLGELSGGSFERRRTDVVDHEGLRNGYAPPPRRRRRCACGRRSATPRCPRRCRSERTAGAPTASTRPCPTPDASPGANRSKRLPRQLAWHA